MITIGYKDYLNRVHGCWMGKCVAGTIGAPYEGMKQLQNLSFDPAMIAQTLPNDGLDLQVLWLEVLEQKGIHFTSEDLAKAAYEKCPSAPGEFAVFKKNCRRGLRPPHTGAFNNAYYLEGMGGPVRAEIWACMAPGDPELAAALAAKDGILDHAGNAVYAEQFVAAAEALAFVEPDLEHCLEQALEWVPKDSRFYRLVNDVNEWTASVEEWRSVRERILRRYGHPDCANLFQNMGFLLLALHYGAYGFLETAMIAVNCGFNTDCTCAAAGAILGIHCGATGLMNTCGFMDPQFKLGVNTARPYDRIGPLAEDVGRAGLMFNMFNNRARIAGGPPAPDIPAPAEPAVHFEIDYQGAPAIGLGDWRALRLCCVNLTGDPMQGVLALTAPEGWRVSPAESPLTLPPGEHADCELAIEVPENLPRLDEINLLTARFEGENLEPLTYTFGLTGAAVWAVMGPFWENNVSVPPLRPGEKYWTYVTAGCASEPEKLDRIRDYHLNAFVDWPKEYLEPGEIAEPVQGHSVSLELERVNLYEDRFSVGQLVGWQGPCVVYLARWLYSPEDRTAYLQIGHSGGFRLWLNGALLAERAEGAGWWTNENVHVLNVPIRKGENLIVLKLARRGGEAHFSLVFSEGGSCADHFADFGSIRPGHAVSRA